MDHVCNLFLVLLISKSKKSDVYVHLQLRSSKKSDVHVHLQLRSKWKQQAEKYDQKLYHKSPFDLDFLFVFLWRPIFGLMIQTSGPLIVLNPKQKLQRNVVENIDHKSPFNLHTQLVFLL